MFIIFSIVCATLIFIIFKYFERFRIDISQAIVVNYLVAGGIGFMFSNNTIDIKQVSNTPWFYGALVLGLLFITIFYVMALTSQKNGVSVASVASKMSVIIPVVFGIFIYHETSSIQKLIGVTLALIAVYLVSVKTSSRPDFKHNLTLPFILFLGSGTIDTLLKYLETNYIPNDSVALFSAIAFWFAALFGGLMLIFNSIKTPLSLKLKNLIGGTLLGFVNYGAIYSLIRALDHESLESSGLFTINNVGVVMLSTLAALILFKERLTFKNWVGISLAIASILLVSLA